MSPRFATAGWIATLLVAGCAATHGVVASAPGVRYVPPADRYVRSVLLDFETPTDAAFVDGDAASRAIDPTLATNHVLSAGAGTTIRLGALVRGRAFPGTWDLVGVRLFSPERTTCAVALADDGRPADQAEASLSAGRWQTVWLDLRKLAAATRSSTPSDPPLEVLVAPLLRPVLIDEVVLAQSGIVVAESRSPRTNETFRVARVGTAWRATLGERTLATLPAAPFVDDGFRVVEANAARVVFADAGGAMACVDRLGRLIRDGAIAPPASVAGVDGAARLIRNAPGDRDNDGFDETRGCFTLRASGDRFVIRLEPDGGGDAAGVVLDVDGLRADGLASVWVQGERIDATTRTTNADGAARTIVELPLRIERPVEVTVSVR